MSGMDMGVRTPLREVRLRVGVCAGIIMLSCDFLNPVKIVCAIMSMDSWWIALPSFLALIIIVVTNAYDLIYFTIKVFLHSILSIFFSSMEVLGKQNIPSHGPVIFTGNHMNQFVDGAVILVTNPHRVGFLVAEKSFHKPIIGDLARATACIPVSRPQDYAKKGSGQVMVDGFKIIGEGTAFTSVAVGDKLRVGREKEAYKLNKIVSDTEAEIAKDDNTPLDVPQRVWLSYDIFQFVDQSKMFDAAHSALAKGQCLGIFPEGGSHDNTDLLPLKVGVAAIAFGALEKYDCNVPIVPVGLNYFRGHRFRGRVLAEFGEPIRIDKELFQLYRENKRLAYQKLLTQVEDGMRSVLVTAPDYDTLKLVHTARRLYQRPQGAVVTKVRQDLSRRFSIGFRLLKDKLGNTLPEDVVKLQKKLIEYQDTLDYWGLKDYQINNLDLPFSTLLYTFLHGLAVWIVASIPSLILNAPVGIAASYFAISEAKKDLKASRVKLAARDVLLSKKIVFSLMAVPILWVAYAVMLALFTSLQNRTIVVLFISCPLFSYFGVMAVEAGMMDLKDLRPAFLRLSPAFQSQAVLLPKLRASLQREVRLVVRKYGPAFGSLYYDEHVQWDQFIHNKKDTDTDDEEGVTAAASRSSSETDISQRQDQLDGEKDGSEAEAVFVKAEDANPDQDNEPKKSK